MASEKASGAAGGAVSGAQIGTQILPGWGTAIGAVVGGIAGALGSKKKAPPTISYKAPNVQAEQNKAIQGNLVASDDIEALLARSNSFLQTQANDMMEKAVPGWGAFSKNLIQAGQQSLDNRYDVPQEVQDNLTRLSAEHGVSRGTRGQFNQYSLLRDLGVNMLDWGDRQFQNAINALTSVTGVAPRVSPISPLSFYISPQTQLASAIDTAKTQAGINQAGANAGTAAQNFNNQNMWDNLAASLTYAGAAYDIYQQGKQPASKTTGGSSVPAGMTY